MAALEIVAVDPGQPDALASWDAFVDQSPQGSLFCRSPWLYACCGDDFSLITVRRNGSIVAGLPLPFARSEGSAMVQPNLTGPMGALLDAPAATAGKALSAQIAVLAALAEAVPRGRRFWMKLHPTLDNALPFLWHGFQLTRSYTYQLRGIRDADSVWKRMDHSKKKNVKKARKTVTIHQDVSADAFFENHKATLAAQNTIPFYTRQYLQRIFAAGAEHGCGKSWQAIGANGEVHAAIYVAWDARAAYYLVSTIDPAYRNSGAATLLILTAIEHVSQYVDVFDFEGSTLPGVERSFRKLGAQLVPFSIIERGSGLRYRTQLLMERAFRRLGLKE